MSYGILYLVQTGFEGRWLDAAVNGLQTKISDVLVASRILIG